MYGIKSLSNSRHDLVLEGTGIIEATSAPPFYLVKSCVMHAGLFVSRAAVGLGEGVAPSSATDMVARVISQDERSRAMSFIFGGLHVGSLLGLFVAPPLIERFGWPTVFYAFGLLGQSIHISMPR